MEINTQTPLHKLQERYMELIEHVQEPYLTAERRHAICRELGRLSFELDQREADGIVF